MHPDLKHFYETVITAHNCDALPYEYKTTMSYRNMLDTHPNCEELLDTFAELAIDIFNGDTTPRKIEQMNEIERTLDSCRLPF